MKPGQKVKFRKRTGEVVDATFVKEQDRGAGRGHRPLLGRGGPEREVQHEIEPGEDAAAGEAHHHEDLPLVDGQIDILDPQGLPGLLQYAGAVVPFRQQFERFFRMFSEDFIERFHFEFDCHTVLFLWPAYCCSCCRTRTNYF